MPSVLRGRPLLTALTFVMVGIFPLYLTSSQILAIDGDLGFGVAQLGIGTALHFGIAAALAQPISIVVSRVGAPMGLRLGALSAMAASLVAVSASVGWLLLVALTLGGLANGFMQVATNVYLARDAVFHRQGVSFAAKQGAIPLANSVAGLLLPVVGVALGWRWPFGMASVLALIAILIAPPLVNAHPTAGSDGGEPWTGISIPLRWLAVGGFCGGAAGNSLSLFVVPSAVDQGITQSAAGTFLAFSAGLVFAIRIVVGTVADRRRSSGHPEMVSLLGIGALACAVLALADTVGLYAIWMPIAMVGAWGWPALAYFTVVRIHPEAPARASGVVLTGNLTGTVIGPLAVGFLADAGRFGAAWTLCGLLAAIAAGSMFMSWRAHRSRDTASATPDADPAPVASDDPTQRS